MLALCDVLTHPLFEEYCGAVSMMRWFGFGGAVVLGLILLWMVNDVRLQVRQSVDTVNRDLPEILEKIQTTTEITATLSHDIKQLRELVVGDSAPRENNMVAYEVEVLRLIENSGGRIGVKKMLGTGLTDPLPAQEWVVRERKTSLWDLARSRSKADLLDRIGHSAVLKREWFMETVGNEIVSLVDWVKQHHPSSRELEAKAVEIAE